MCTSLQVSLTNLANAWQGLWRRACKNRSVIVVFSWTVHQMTMMISKPRKKCCFSMYISSCKSFVTFFCLNVLAPVTQWSLKSGRWSLWHNSLPTQGDRSLQLQLLDFVWRLTNCILDSWWYLLKKTIACRCRCQFCLLIKNNFKHVSLLLKQLVWLLLMKFWESSKAACSELTFCSLIGNTPLAHDIVDTFTAFAHNTKLSAAVKLHMSHHWELTLGCYMNFDSLTGFPVYYKSWNLKTSGMSGNFSVCVVFVREFQLMHRCCCVHKLSCYDYQTTEKIIK